MSKMEKVINRLIDEAVVNVDKYINNGSTWLIFTESKQWVIELTKDGTLWYNYNFFKNIFVYMSIDVVENQHYITKWVEDNIINGVKYTSFKISGVNSSVEDTIQNGVKRTSLYNINRSSSIEYTIQNGVKETKGLGPSEVTEKEINSTIQNGVKHTEHGDWEDGDERLDDIIQNGVKDICSWKGNRVERVKDTIQNGIKKTKTPIDGCLTSTMEWMDENETNSVPKLIDYVVKYGVKQTRAMDEWVNAESIVDKTMKDGVKSTKPGGYLGSIEMKGKIVHQLESPKQNNEVEDVIQQGVKHTVCSSSPFVFSVKDTLQHGVIETFDETHHRRREVVRTIRDGIKQTCAQIPSIQRVVERVIEEGIKQTIGEEYHHKGRIDGVIKNGIKEVKELPDMSGELRGYGDYYRRQKNMAKPHSLYVKDVIENGNKDTLKKST